MYMLYCTYGMEPNLEALEKDLREDFEDCEREWYDNAVYDYFTDMWNDFRVTCEDCELSNEEFHIEADLCLWNGRRSAYANAKGLLEAIRKCLCDLEEFQIYEDKYGNLRVSGYHHDGENNFIIKRKTSKGLRCVKFRKTVYGV